jgi:8-oxo-dGTP pyrophosphatase MutT (NUDIX family)
MEQEYSAGGVVIRFRDGRWWLAVIEPQSSEDKRSRRRKPVVALPKGLVDKGEKPEQTAVREVREETGVEATLIAKLTDIHYIYARSWSDGQRVSKEVSFFLLMYRSGEIGEITPEMRVEVRKAEWIPLDDAPRQLTHRGEQEVVNLAADYILAHPGLKS